MTTTNRNSLVKFATTSSSVSFLTPNDADPPTRPPPPMLPSLPDDFDLFDTTHSTKVTLAPRFSFHRRMMTVPNIRPRQENEQNANKENGNQFSAQMIESAPKMPLIDSISKAPRLKMRSTAARFWNEASNDDEQEV